MQVSSQVDEVEGAEEDDHDEEEDVPLTGGAQHGLVEVLPIVLGHQAEGGEEGPAEGVEARVAVVGVGPESLVAGVVVGTDSRAGGVAAEEGVQLAGAVVKVPVAAVQVELGPRLVEGIERGRIFSEVAVSTTAAKDPLGLFGGKVLDAFLREHSHIDLCR